MKAWYLSIRNSDEGNFLVFANTRNEARQQADSNDMFYDSWIDIEARRASRYDNRDDLPKRDLDKLLWRDGWQWLDHDSPDEEASDEEFDKWYDEIFGGKS